MDLIDLSRSEGKNPVELTIDANGIAENTYGRHQESTPEVASLISLVADVFPDFLTDSSFKTWEMIGFTKADGITYFEDTVSVVYRGVPQKTTPVVARVFNPHPESQFLDYYVIKYGLKSQLEVLKVYDATFGLHPLPNLPLGARLLTQMGVGVHFGSVEHQNFRDVYFAHPNANAIEYFASYHHLKYPSHYDDERWREREYLYGYGLTYDVSSLNLLKLKRYFFPHDPALKKLFAK